MKMKARFHSFYLFPISGSTNRLIDPQIQPEVIPSQEVSFRSDAIRGILDLSVTQVQWADVTIPPAEPLEPKQLSVFDRSVVVPRVNHTTEARLQIPAQAADWCNIGVSGHRSSDPVSKTVDDTIRRFFPKEPELRVDAYRFFAFTPHTHLDPNMPLGAQEVGKIHRQLVDYIHTKDWYQTSGDRETFWQSVCAQYQVLFKAAEYPEIAHYGLLGALLHYVPSNLKWVLLRTASHLTMYSVCVSIERMLRTQTIGADPIRYAYFDLPSVGVVGSNSGLLNLGQLFAMELLRVYGAIRDVHPGMSESQLPPPFNANGLPSGISPLSQKHLGWFQEWQTYEAQVIQQGGTSALYSDEKYVRCPQLSATHIVYRDQKISISPKELVEEPSGSAARKRPGGSRPLEVPSPPLKVPARRPTPPLVGPKGAPFSIDQLRYDAGEGQELFRRRSCVPTSVKLLPPPPREPPGCRTVEDALPHYFKFQGFASAIYLDGIQPSTFSPVHPVRLLPGQKQLFTYAGNTHWALGEPQTADLNPTRALGPSWSAPSDLRGNTRYTQFQRRRFPLRLPTQKKTELFRKLRSGLAPLPGIRRTVRPSRNEDCVRLHGWPNTEYGRKAQLQRSTDLITAYDYEQATRSQAASETMQMEALADAQSLQTFDGQAVTHAQRTQEEQQPNREQPATHLNYFRTRDREPGTVIQRATSIVASTFGVHPRFSPGMVVARTVEEVQTMFRSLRTTPVFGGDPQQCPLITSLSFETIVGTPDMRDADRTIQMTGATSYRRQIQAFPYEEHKIQGLYGGADWSGRGKHKTPLQTFPIPDPDPSAYVYWSEENKRRLRYVPNVQTVKDVPYAMVIFRHNLPVFVIPLYLLFRPASLFDAQMDRREYYRKVKGKPDTVVVDLATTPSSPSSWALEVLSGVDVRKLQYTGHLWLVTDPQRELRLLTTAFSDITATRTHFNGCPNTDTFGAQDPEHQFPGRCPGPASTDFVSFLSLTDCLLAVGEFQHFQPIPSQQGRGKVPPFRTTGPHHPSPVG